MGEEHQSGGVDSFSRWVIALEERLEAWLEEPPFGMTPIR